MNEARYFAGRDGLDQRLPDLLLPTLNRLATHAMGLTGADVERIVREARLKARREKRAIRYEDLEDGIRSHRPPVAPDLRYRLAVHEAGHAVVHHALGLGPIYGLVLDGALGSRNRLGIQARAGGTEEWYGDMLAMLMAGRAAEEFMLGTVSSGSGGGEDSDLARATLLAFEVERTLGLGSHLPLLYRPHPVPTQVLDRDPDLATRVHARLEKASDDATAILTRRERAFNALTKALFEAQALDEQAVLQILEEG
jgi:ATP-dependent Zn proteases